MANTNIRSRQIKDGDVLRADVNTSTSGSALITKVVAGTGVSLSSTGADAGTGDVTVSLNAVLDNLTDVTITSPSNTQILSYNGTQWVNSAAPSGSGTVTSVALATGTTGTDVGVTGSPITSSGTITLNIPDASATARGVVTTGIQAFAGAKTFSSRLTVSAEGLSVTSTTNNNTITATSASTIISASPSGVYPSTNVLIVKNNNTSGDNSSCIALDSALSGSYMDIRGNSSNVYGMRLFPGTALTAVSTTAAFQLFTTSDASYPGHVYFDSGSNNNAAIMFRTAPASTGAAQRMRIFANGNICISNSTTDSGFKLDVNGTQRIQGQLTVSTGGAAITGNSTVTGTLNVTSTFTLSDAQNIVVGSTTGTKIGTATTQKIGFWNAAPIAQPTTAVAAATFVANTGTAVNDASTFDGYTIKQVVKALRNAGLLA